MGKCKSKVKKKKRRMKEKRDFNEKKIKECESLNVKLNKQA